MKYYSHSSPGRVAFSLVSALVFTLTSALPAAAVTTADEICLVTDDPCVISSTVVIDSAATIDFGLRTVNLVTGGQLDFGNGAGTQFLCGEFNVTATGNALKMRGKDAFNDFEGATATIATRRACSGDGSTLCVSDSTCTVLGGPGGTCTSGGTGNMTIGSNIKGEAVFPAVLTLLAGGDITLSGSRGQVLGCHGDILFSCRDLKQYIIGVYGKEILS